MALSIPLDIAETASNSQELTDKDLESMTVYSLSQTYMNAWKDQPKEWSLSILFEVQENNVNTPYSLKKQYMEKISKSSLYDQFYNNLDGYNKVDTWNLLSLLPVSSRVINDVMNIPKKANID